MNEVCLPGLIVPIEARIDKLERGLKKANVAPARCAKTTELRARQGA